MGGKIVEIRTNHKYEYGGYFSSLCKYVERCCIFKKGAAFEVFGSRYVWSSMMKSIQSEKEI